MLLEITTAAEFFCRFLTHAGFPADHIQKFKACLIKLLSAKFDSHWNPSDPYGGNAFRAISCFDGKLDPILLKAAAASGILSHQACALFSEENRLAAQIPLPPLSPPQLRPSSQLGFSAQQRPPVSAPFVSTASTSHSSNYFNVNNYFAKPTPVNCSNPQYTFNQPNSLDQGILSPLAQLSLSSSPTPPSSTCSTPPPSLSSSSPSSPNSSMGKGKKLALITLQNFHCFFPSDLVVWVDPGCVSYRINDYGNITTIYENRAAVTLKRDEKNLKHISNTSGKNFVMAR